MTTLARLIPPILSTILHRMKTADHMIILDDQSLARAARSEIGLSTRTELGPIKNTENASVLAQLSINRLIRCPAMPATTITRKMLILTKISFHKEKKKKDQAPS